MDKTRSGHLSIDIVDNKIVNKKIKKKKQREEKAEKELDYDMNMFQKDPQGDEEELGLGGKRTGDEKKREERKAGRN